MYQIYRVPSDHKGFADEPDYLVIDGKFFPTVSHPRGWSAYPEYELHNDGKIYRSINHPQGISTTPDYEIGTDCLLYRTPEHPDGELVAPEYEIRELTG